MIKRINQLIQKYDSATVFVAASTIAVIAELSLMRIFVPTSVTSDNHGSGLLMEQVYSNTSVAESFGKLSEWNSSPLVLAERLTAAPKSWQKDIQCVQAFGFKDKAKSIQIPEVDEKAIQNAAADYAASELYLQSVMIGRTPLANINGSIYRVGDDISLRDGEIVLVVADLGSDFAIIHLDTCPEIKRTIYLTHDMHIANRGDIQ